MTSHETLPITGNHTTSTSVASSFAPNNSSVLSEWQKKNACFFVHATQALSQDYLNQLGIYNAAYIRYGDLFYYVNKYNENTYTIKNLLAEPNELSQIDDLMNTAQAHQARLVTDDEQLQIRALIGHEHLSEQQSTLKNLGLVLSGIAAAITVFTTAGSFLLAFAGGSALLGVSLVGLTGYTYWWLFDKYLPDFFVNCFGRENFWVDKMGQALDGKQKFAIVFTLLTGVCGAIPYCLSTYSKLTSLAVLFGATPTLTIAMLASVFSGVILVAMAVCLSKQVIELIKSGNVLGKAKELYQDIFGADPEVSHDQTSGKWAKRLQNAGKLVLLAGYTVFASIGLAALALDSAWSLGVRVMAVIGNVHFYVGNTINGIANYFKKTPAEEATKPLMTKSQAQDAAVIVVNATTTSILAALDSPDAGLVWSTMVYLSAWLSSLSNGSSAIGLSGGVKLPAKSKGGSAFFKTASGSDGNMVVSHSSDNTLGGNPPPAKTSPLV